MFRSEKGITRVRIVVLVLAILIIAAMTIRVMIGENGLIQQWKEERAKQQYENNIVIELTNSTK
ncbi:MAG: hypothetical protein IKE91_02425 [Clostridia bacterium]|nr:hypothetical protein [Clostridia bacterium]